MIKYPSLNHYISDWWSLALLCCSEVFGLSVFKLEAEVLMSELGAKKPNSLAPKLLSAKNPNQAYTNPRMELRKFVYPSHDHASRRT
jgi:hypothetical protein